MNRYNLLLEKLKKKSLLVCSHRGQYGANIIQNTLISAKNAELHGADIVEIDVAKSSDGIFYGFHVGVEQVVFKRDIDITKMTSTEIDTLIIYNGLSEPTNTKLDKLDYILKNLNEDTLVNIDKAWLWRDDLIKFFDDKEYKNRVILKSSNEHDFIKVLEDSKSDLMFMPIIKTIEEYEFTKKFDVNTVAVEMIFANKESELIKAEFFEKLKEDNVLPWVNMITLNDSVILGAKFDDNTLITEGPEKSLYVLQDMGFKIVQTDWLYLVNKYKR